MSFENNSAEASNPLLADFASGLDLPDPNKYDDWLRNLEESAREHLPLRRTVVVESHGSFMLDETLLPEPTVPGLKLTDEEKVKADKTAQESIVQFATDKQLTSPDYHLSERKNSTLRERVGKFFKEKSVGRKIGRFLAMSTIATSAFFLVPDGESKTTSTEQRTPVTAAPAIEIPTTQTEDTILIAPEAQPAQPIKQDMKL